MNDEIEIGLARLSNWYNWSKSESGLILRHYYKPYSPMFRDASSGNRENECSEEYINELDAIAVEKRLLSMRDPLGAAVVWKFLHKKIQSIYRVDRMPAEQIDMLVTQAAREL
jgi:hypothetical protein